MSKNDRIKWEEIKLSIEFPLKSGAQGNNILLFFKQLLSVLMASNKEILLKIFRGKSDFKSRGYSV